MKTFSVTVPDNKANIFIEWMKSISFVKKIEVFEKNEIPDWHKGIIDERNLNFETNPESFVLFEDLEKEIDKKYDL